MFASLIPSSSGKKAMKIKYGNSATKIYGKTFTDHHYSWRLMGALKQDESSHKLLTLILYFLMSDVDLII